MKQGLTLPEMAAELKRQQDAKRDFLVDTRSMRFELEGDDVQLGMELPGDGATLMPLRNVAHAQFASTLGVPKVYYDRMRAQAPDLLATNLNHWLGAQEKRKLVRTLDGNVRALLSDMYRPLDNYDLATAVLPKLQELGAAVQSTAITENRFYLKAVTDQISGDIKEGDVVQAGIVISNSEIGDGSLRLEEMDFRLVCTNGMIREAAFRKAHLGRASGDLIEGAREFYRDETRRLEDAAFWNKVRDTADAVFDRERFNRRILEYREAADVELTQPIKAVEEIGRRFDLVEDEKDDVLSHLIKGGDLTQWGLANALTQTSQRVDDYERATHLEALGGRVIELKPEDWAISVN